MFPPYTAFFSSLKGRNTLEPSTNDVLSTEEAQVAGSFSRLEDSPRLSPEQISGVAPHRYEQLSQMFVEKRFVSVAPYALTN